MMVLYNYEITGELIDIEYLNAIIDADGEVPYDDDFFKELVAGVLENRDEINRVINLNIKNWSFSRLSAVDRVLIQIGVYEMLHTLTPKSIIINEIINITHEYSDLGIKHPPVLITGCWTR